MNLVEAWLGIVDRQAIRRSVFTSVKDLNTKMLAFIDGWNDRPHPFIWIKTAEEVLKKANRPTASNPRHLVCEVAQPTLRECATMAVGTASVGRRLPQFR